MVTIDSNLGPDLYIRPERTKIPTISDNLFWTEVFFLSENDRMRCELRYSHAFYVLYFQASCLSTKNWLFIAFRPYFFYINYNTLFIVPIKITSYCPTIGQLKMNTGLPLVF